MPSVSERAGACQQPGPAQGAIEDLLSRDPVCAEIVAYLSRNTRAVDTARGIAEWWINREIRPTQEALLKLLDHGIVRSYLRGAARVYAYTRNPVLRRELSRYVRSLIPSPLSSPHRVGRGQGEGAVNADA